MLVPSAGATACCYSPDGAKVACGAQDGSVQIWKLKGRAHNYLRPDGCQRDAHARGTDVRSRVRVLRDSSTPAEEHSRLDARRGSLVNTSRASKHIVNTGRRLRHLVRRVQPRRVEDRVARRRRLAARLGREEAGQAGARLRV